MDKRIRTITAVDFLKLYQKMCESGNGDCEHCEINKEKQNGLTCRQFMQRYPNRTIQIVLNWYENSSDKTMLQDLLFKLPDVQMHRIGVPIMCPVHCGYTDGVPEWCKTGVKTEKCFECWNRPLGVKK